MKIIRTIMIAGAVSGMLASSAAMAGEATRSMNAMPDASVAVATTAPVRKASATKKKSHLDGSAGFVIPAIVGAAVIAGGVVVATNDNDDAPVSPG